ncbi:MAG TPA: hypothetical protein PKD32_12905 [Saprospiraceae bacterium]|nr:hypothetical protein [Saprospiraceae bacterium]
MRVPILDKLDLYNPAIARFLSVDPLTSDYPSWTPYAFAMNRPIDGIDLDGLEYVNSTTGEYDPYPNGAYDGDVHDDFYDTKAKNHQNHQQDLIDKGFLPSAPLVTITDERPAPAKVDPSTIQSTSNGNYFSSTSGISHYFNDNTSIGNSTTYLWSGEKWDLIRSEQQQYKNNLITVDAFINALANFTVGAISLFDFGISPGTLTGFRASYVASAAAKTSSQILSWGDNAKGHLIKHANVLGFGGYTPQQLQKMLPQLRGAANQLLNGADATLTRVGQWHGHQNAIMYISNGKMLVTEANGTFITVINKTSNNWYNLAKPLK